jgi:ubiquinone/menaquinone biosynthesis C-methylase UbiE
MKYAMRESIFKNRLANQVRLGKGRMALDLGCETATLTISIEKTFPEAEVVGVDIARAITLSRALVFVSPEQCT